MQCLVQILYWILHVKTSWHDGTLLRGLKAHFLQQGSAGSKQLHPKLHFGSQAVVQFPPPLILFLPGDIISLYQI